MCDPEIRHSHVNINNSVTHLVQYGNKESFINFVNQQSSDGALATIKEQSLDQLSSLKVSKPFETTHARIAHPKRIIVFVPGNPGVLGVYHDFLVSLYRNIMSPLDKNSNVLIIGISHNDFDHPDSCNYERSERICIEEEKLNFIEKSIAKEHKPHDVELQVLNKLIILKRLVKLDPDLVRVVFIGHSIGCYVILRLLQDKTVASTHAGSVLIHPALDNLAMSTKGTRISRYFAFKMDLVMRFIAYMCEAVLPTSFRLTLAKQLCSAEFVQSSSEIVMESIAQLGSSNAVKALVEMAKSEFLQVRDMDHKTMIGPHVEKLRLIYATGDEWVIAKSREELRRCYPSLQIEEQPTMHAFIMDVGVVSSYAMKIGMLVQAFFD